MDGGDSDEGGGGMGSVFISFESAIGIGLGGEPPSRAEGFFSSEARSDERVSAGAELVIAGEVTESSVSVPAIEAFPGSGAGGAASVLEGETDVSAADDFSPPSIVGISCIRHSPPIAPV